MRLNVCITVVLWACKALLNIVSNRKKEYNLERQQFELGSDQDTLQLQIETLPRQEFEAFFVKTSLWFGFLFA